MSLLLFVAPTVALQNIAEEIIHERGLDIPVITSSDKTVLKDVAQYKDAMVIISRGGVASELKELHERTIVEVNTSFDDILIAIERLIRRGCKRIGVVMRENILNNVAMDFDISGTKIFVRPCMTYEEIETTVQDLYSKGVVDGIAGCQYAIHVAQQRQIIYEYVDSGKKSIARAIDEALRILRAKKLETLQLERLNAVVGNIQEGIVVFGDKQEPLFFNATAQRILGSGSSADWKKWISQGRLREAGEQLVDIDGNKILLQSVPLKVRNLLENEVLILQEVRNIEKTEQRVRLSLYQKGLYAKKHFTDILTCSEKMKKLLALANRFAQTEANVLIYGETGTGKEGMAQSIHNASKRADSPFVSVSCASIPANLIESELFGYVDGAFTGARRSGKKGLFELAHKGTIFLDEIGELPLDIQGRLLRVLQEHEIMRVGDDKILPLDIRVVCATNKDLKQMVREGSFREDLYYRINVLKLHLPPLRERREDIPMLLQYYLHKYAPEISINQALSKRMQKKLFQYAWPGNIRELRNIAEVLSCYQDDAIEEDRLEALLYDGAELAPEQDAKKGVLELPLGIPLKKAEQEIIQQMLRQYSPEEVCTKLGISRVTLWRKSKN